MSLQKWVGVIYALQIFGGLLAIGFSTYLHPPIPLFVLGVVGWMMSFLTACPKCGKSVFKVEGRRPYGIPVSYWQPVPEAVCSRCGNILLKAPRSTAIDPDGPDPK